MKLGIDIGGTFTDFVLFNQENKQLYFAKTLTTYPDPTVGIFNGIKEIEQKFGFPVKNMDGIVHGTTLVTNAVIERKGAKTAFITTKGFEDVLEIGREMRYDIYDIFLTMPKPLVPRNLRMGVSERVDIHGNIVTPMDENAMESLASTLEENGIEAVGVCLLNSFANTSHEKALGDYLSKNVPDIYYSLSSEIMPEIREYERSSATAMNAYVQPITDKYLKDFETQLRKSGFEGNVNIMISSGRLTTIDGARKSPIHLLESGPAGGAMAGVFFGKHLGEENLLCFDMGGTTAKACVIYEGEPEITNHFEAGRVKRFKKGSGLPVRIPVIDLMEIGAGGGSIARVNNIGLLTVGPDSASSTPGPACYNLGGEDPTVTDADLVLGYLNADYFLGGEMRLSVEAARKAIEAKLAKPLGISIEEAAMGVHKIVNENMANAARVHVLEKGMDPRHFNMIGFGGAGPVHSFGVAKLLNTKRLIIPVGAGVTSALGFLVSPVASEKIHSHIMKLNDIDWKEVNTFLEDMTDDGYSFLEQSDIAKKDATVNRVVEMRYAGQGHEITIALPEGELNESCVAEIEKRFIKEYEFRYNRSIKGMAMEMVTWRVVVKGPTPEMKVKQFSAGVAATDAYKGTRKVYFEETGYLDCPVYDRYALKPHEKFDGPAIIEETESTTVVGVNSSVQVDNDKNIIIDLH
ncbi:hydantoinase/oxoprolinase family protein [Costertonia aggregata]|uniref:Hydantoinase/oxoprolinase family protein n=1 Tax=Costertonia aggregata TaxID=343403 RepID=A0A7H9ANM2_9FLAO|nr:hydantoinase/oxoprolinase family protein [Costertonia aggregata]QLG45030.1 hydantoinase/oxoprolinase family protein [Costertonia aggregata]